MQKRCWLIGLTLLLWLWGVQPSAAGLEVELEFVNQYTLASPGFTGITYDRSRNLFYAISPEQPDQFYTLQLDLSGDWLRRVNIGPIIHLEQPPSEIGAIALAPLDQLFISDKATPAIQIYSLVTGELQQTLSIAKRYREGTRPHLGWESLTIATDGQGDPYRLFAATESALAGDFADQTEIPLRWLHYMITPTTPALLISEHLYPLTNQPDYGLTEILALPEPGNFLSLESNPTTAKLFLVNSQTATDVSTYSSFKVLAPMTKPLDKQLIYTFDNLTAGPLRGMTLGPRLADGSQSLIVLGGETGTQFYLFKLGLIH